MNKILFLFVAAIFLSGCAKQSNQARQNPVQRYCWVTGLKPEKAEYYHELHANPWPSVTAQIKKSHIQNFSIHEIDILGKTYLIAYLEYTGSDFAEDMKLMGEDPETRRWWKETDPCQSPLPQADGIWADTTEVFFLK